MKRGNLCVFSFAVISIALSACGRQSTTPIVEAIPATQSDSVESPAVSDLHPSKIIGENNLVKVKADGSNVDASLRKLIDAFGLMIMDQTGACTATHIGNGYVLTAGHCLLDESLPGPQTLSNTTCSKVKIYWGYRGSAETGSVKPTVTLVSQCTQIVHAELTRGTDFAIVKVDQAPKAKINISLEGKRTSANTKLTIFGYPQARPLEWSQYCALKDGNFAQLSSPSLFSHQCDTEGGNSGSAILAITASGTAKVIGVHDGAAPISVDYNYATYMYDVRSILKSKGFDLDQATASPLSI